MKMANIRVFIRVRPLNQNEIDDDQFEIVQILDDKVNFPSLTCILANNFA
jgi:hypothetical protein